MISAKAQDGLAKLFLFGVAVATVELVAREHGGSMLHAGSMILSGVGNWFDGLGAFAPVAALIALFCLDGFLSGLRK